MADRQKKGGGTRKFDRNRMWCRAYRDSGRREKSKALRIAKHLLRHPRDLQSETAFAGLSIVAKKAAQKEMSYHA